MLEMILILLLETRVREFQACAFFEHGSLDEITFEFGSKLKCIEEYAFYYSSMRMIQIPSCVEFIGDCCFFGCHSLCDITFESGSKLQRLGEGAFYSSGVTRIQIPSSVEFIGNCCFGECKSLCEITFESESSLKEIGNNAFSGTNLKRIEVPKKCEIISGLSLAGVKEVSICRENPFLVHDELFIKSYDKKVLIRYIGNDSEIMIGREVEIISKGCFKGCESILEVKFERGSKLERIESYAFYGIALERIQIPMSVDFIGNDCFSGCYPPYEVTFE
jgi:hypothetical protein